MRVRNMRVLDVWLFALFAILMYTITPNYPFDSLPKLQNLLLLGACMMNFKILSELLEDDCRCGI